MEDLLGLEIHELKIKLEEIDSSELIKYLVNLDIQQKNCMLGKIEKILGKSYLDLLKNAI